MKSLALTPLLDRGRLFVLLLKINANLNFICKTFLNEEKQSKRNL